MLSPFLSTYPVNQCLFQIIAMPPSTTNRIAKNTVFLYMRMLFVMLINIFSVRYVLKGLGVVDYGVFNVVAGLVTMFNSLSSVISSATLRFHSYAIGEGKEEKISDVFTASFNIYAFLALLILFLGEAIGVWFLNTQADIPVDRMFAANWVYQFTMLTFVIGLMTAPFSSLIFAYERMSAFAIISVAECVLKFLLAFILVYLSCDHLIFYGLGLLAIQITHFFVYFIVSKRGGGRFHYKRHVENGLYKQMLTFSGWTLFSSSAGISISQLVTMITNVFFGPVVNAARAIAFQVNTAMSSFVGSIVTAIRPPMIKQYADGDFERVKVFFNFSNKVIYYGLLLLVLPLFFEMDIVLRLWLNISDAQTILFCRLILINVLILSLNNPIAIIIQATGNIRDYSVFVEIPTILVFPITWAVFAMGCPAESAFYVLIIAVSISHIIRLICLKRQFPLFSYREYCTELLIPAFVITAVVSSCIWLLGVVMSEGFVRLALSVLICAVMVVSLSSWFGLNKSEKSFIARYIQSFLGEKFVSKS